MSTYDWCDDYVQEHKPYVTGNNLRMYHKTVVPLRVSGTRGFSGGNNVINNLAFYTQGGANELTNTPAVDWNLLVSRCYAHLPDQEPIVNLTETVTSFMETVSLVKELHEIFSITWKKFFALIDDPGTTASQGYLAYKFGILPMISDLRKVANLQQEIARRLRELKDYQKPERDSVDLLHTRSGLTPTVVANWLCADWLCYITSSVELEVKAWAVMHPQLAEPIPSEFLLDVPETLNNKSDQRINGLERLLFGLLFTSKRNGYRKLLGLNPRLSTAWESIPFSWLADYFVNFGEFLQNHDGYLDYNLNEVSIMCMQERKTKDVGHTNLGGLTWLPGSSSVISKERKMYYNPPVSLYIRPILTPGHVGILTALAGALSPKYGGQASITVK